MSLNAHYSTPMYLKPRSVLISRFPQCLTCASEEGTVRSAFIVLERVSGISPVSFLARTPSATT